jgi:hypothetical protein
MRVGRPGPVPDRVARPGRVSQHGCMALVGNIDPTRERNHRPMRLAQRRSASRQTVLAAVPGGVVLGAPFERSGLASLLDQPLDSARTDAGGRRRHRPRAARCRSPDDGFDHPAHRRHNNRRPGDHEDARFDQLALAALVAAFLLGLGWEALVLWWMPGKLSGLVLMTLPVAAAPPARRNRPLPEHPRQRLHAEHSDSSRTGPSPDASPVPTSSVVPVSPPLHRDAALVEKNNARIEGRRLGADVPKIALR